MHVDDEASNGPGTYCSLRRMMPFNSKVRGSGCVSMTWRTVSTWRAASTWRATSGRPHRTGVGGLHHEGGGTHGAPPGRALLVDEVLLRCNGGGGGGGLGRGRCPAP